MTRKSTGIGFVFFTSLLIGMMGIYLSRKTPLNLSFDLSIILFLTGLLGLLISVSIFLWIKKTLFYRIGSILLMGIVLSIFSLCLVMIVDIRLLFPKIPSEVLTAEQWKEDLDFLSDALKTHPGYSDSIGNLIYEYRSQVKSKEYTEPQLLTTSMKMVSLLNDGHSFVIPIQLFFNQPSCLPIQVYQFADGVFITDANGKNSDLVGGKILSINDQPLELVLPEIYSLVGANNQWGALHMSVLYLPNIQVLKGLGVIPLINTVPLEIELEGQVIRRNLEAVSALKWALWSLSPNNERHPVGFQMRDHKNELEIINDSLLWMNFNETGPEELLTSIGNQIENGAFGNSIHHLVLDMRNNVGGDNTSYHAFINSLLSTEINITVLTSRKTFSAGINFISALQLSGKKFRIIGEPTGAGHNHEGDAQPIFLPNSGMMVLISTRKWDLIPEETMNAIYPDLPIIYQSSQYFNGRDPWQEALWTKNQVK